jgi:predicted DNA-binding transcriptional regulator AlpA
MPAAEPKPGKRRARVPPLVAPSPTGTTAGDAKPFVPINAKLLIDDAETAALLGLSVGSIANLESRDPDFPRPVDWALERKLRRRTDVEAYVERLKQRRT